MYKREFGITAKMPLLAEYFQTKWREWKKSEAVESLPYFLTLPAKTIYKEEFFGNS